VQRSCIARLHRQAKVLETKYVGDSVRMVVLVARLGLAAECQEFVAYDGPEKAIAGPHSLATIETPSLINAAVRKMKRTTFKLTHEIIPGPIQTQGPGRTGSGDCV
jgi:hypothetical protein